jgi:AraC-like DNA-binding protein
MDGHAHVLLTDHNYQAFPKHYHETYSVAIITGGAKSFHMNNKHFTLDDSVVVTMNPGEIHSGETLTEKGWNQTVILFDEHSLIRFTDENELKSHIIFSNIVKRSKQLRADILSSCDALSHAETDLERDQCFESVMGSIYNTEEAIESVEKFHNKAGVDRAISIMREEPFIKHSLDDLAKLAAMSKFHFLRSFKDSTGLTPHAYLNNIRVERAKNLLLTTDNNISDIALECGFSDQAHLNRAYKKIYGTSPGKIVRK